MFLSVRRRALLHSGAMAEQGMPSLLPLEREVERVWTLLRSALTRWGLRLLAVLLLAALFALLYRALLAGTRRTVRRFPSLAPWLPLADVSAWLSCLSLFLVSSVSLFPASAKLAAPLARVYLVLLLLFLGWALLRRVLARLFSRFGLDASLELLALNVALGVWIAVGLYLVFQQFGINLLPILGGLGIAGVAVGFAAQDLLSNVLAGITLLLDRPFTIGDWIRVNDWEGQVQRLTLRTTRLRTRDNELISIPNNKVAGNDVVNLSAGGPLRIRSSLGVSYRADLDQARTALMGVLEAEPKVLSDPPPRVAVTQLGDSSVSLDLIYWIAPESIPRRPLIQQRVVEASKRALDAAGVEIPFPQRVLHLEMDQGTRALLGRLAPPDGEEAGR